MGGVYLHARPELGVASTKAFSAQVTVLLLLALHLARLRHLSFTDGLAVLEAIESLPALIGEVLKTEPRIEEAARLVAPSHSALYLGRDLHYPVALEGALKLKEISYIHAEGYPTAEMKHGPIALIDEATPCVFVAPRGALHSKTLGNMEEVRARNGPGSYRRRHRGRPSPWNPWAEIFLPIPDAPEIIQPLLAVVPLQLLAYHVALHGWGEISTSPVTSPRA